MQTLRASWTRKFNAFDPLLLCSSVGASWMRECEAIPTVHVPLPWTAEEEEWHRRDWVTGRSNREAEGVRELTALEVGSLVALCVAVFVATGGNL
jgi:hypothetical protein